MLEIKLLKRKFLYDSVELPDPNPELSKEGVRDLFANQYPELTSGQIVGPRIEGEHQIFKIKTAQRTKDKNKSRTEMGGFFYKLIYEENKSITTIK